MTISTMLRGCVSAIAIVGGFSGGQAFAQSASDWTGAYAGLQIGYQSGSAEHSFSNGAPQDDSDPDGVIYGGHAGYNWRNQNIVFGIEADIEGGSVEGDFVNTTGLTSVGGAELNWQGSLRGRVGMASGSNLFYLTAGAVWVDQDYDGGPTPAPACCGYSDTASGWAAGIGIEHAGSGNISYRAEYRHTDLDDASGAMQPTFPGVTMDVSQSYGALRFAASYHF